MSREWRFTWTEELHSSAEPTGKTWKPVGAPVCGLPAQICFSPVSEAVIGADLRTLPLDGWTISSRWTLVPIDTRRGQRSVRRCKETQAERNDLTMAHHSSRELSQDVSHEFTITGAQFSMQLRLSQDLAAEVARRAIAGAAHAATPNQASGELPANLAPFTPSLEAALLNLRPKTKLDRVLAIGHYLHTREGQSSFSTQQLRGRLASAGVPAPKNLSGVLLAGVARGYLDVGRRKRYARHRYSMTEQGRTLVDRLQSVFSPGADESISISNRLDTDGRREDATR